MITADDLKRLDVLAEEVAKLEFTEDDKRRLDDLERQLSEMDLDFLLR